MFILLPIFLCLSSIKLLRVLSIAVSASCYVSHICPGFYPRRPFTIGSCHFYNSPSRAIHYNAFYVFSAYSRSQLRTFKLRAHITKVPIQLQFHVTFKYYVKYIFIDVIYSIRLYTTVFFRVLLAEQTGVSSYSSHLFPAGHKQTRIPVVFK